MESILDILGNCVYDKNIKETFHFCEEKEIEEPY